MAVTDFGKKYAGSFQKRKDEGQLRKNEQREVTVVDDALKRRVAQSVESGARAKATFDRAQEQRKFERNLGAFEAQRDYNLGRISSLMQQDRERRKKAQAEAAAQEAIRQEVVADQTMPSFKRQNLTGNSRFSQAEATGAYNPYEDALAAMKQRIAEQRAQDWPVLPEPGNLPKLTADNQLLGGNFSLEDFNRPQMPNLEIEKQLKEAEEAAARRFDAGEWAEANAQAGWTQIGGRIMQGLNAALEPAQALGADLGASIMGKVFGGPYATYADELAEQVKEKPALGGLYDWAVDPMEKATAYADEINKEGGYLAEIGGSVIQNAVAQIPNAITALMSGGASTALDAFNRAQTTFGGAVLNEAKKMATNPNFLMSFSQMYGGRYEDAVKGGANPYTAALTSTITTLMNSIVEMGGGIENLPFTKATVGDWVKNALDEGKEEVIQQIIDQMGQKAMVDSNIPWYSTEDQNAVINPKVLGENALLGALAGGVIGGPSMVVNNTMNSGMQEQIENFEGAPEISDTAMELIQDENREKLEPAQEENKGQKYAQMSAEEIRAAQESARQTDNYGDPIARLAQETADAEMAEERGESASAPARGETPASRNAPPAQVNVQDTQVEQAARRIENEASKRQFVQAAEKYGEAATVFAHNYEGGDIAAYDRAFNHLYSAGQTNLPLSRIREATDALTAGMSEGAKQAIWQAGRNADVRTIRPGVQQRTTVRLNDRQKRQFKMLDEMAKRYNYEIDIVDSIAGGMANGAYAGGRRIVVAADAAEGAIVQTGVHELVHALKTNDAAGYGVLQDVVLKHLEGSENWLGIDYAVDTRIQEYAAGGVTLTREGAIEEIVAEAVPTFLTDEAAVKAFVRENRTLAEKVRDFFVKFAKEIREIAERYMQREGMDRDEIANLLGRSDALTEIAQTFDRAMEAAGEKEAADGGEVVFAGRKKEIRGADDVSEWTADSRFLGAVLNKAERKLFRDTVNNMHNLKIEQASNGEYIVEAGRCLVYTDGNAENPKVFRVVKFNTDDGTELSFMVDYYKKAEKGGMVFDEIRALLEGMFDKGIALEYTNAVHLPVWRKKRTGKGKARYSLGEGNRGEVSAEREGKFSLNKPVEQVGDLVAVHNVDPEGLARSLNLGGVPAPSIAVVKSSSGHSKFGTVSLVFHKDSIDPEADARNRVYGYDAWTPDKHNARIEYEVNEEVKKRIDAALREYTSEIPALYRNGVMNFVSELDRKINNDYGFDGLIEDAAGNYGFMAAYLASAGDQVEMERTTRTEGGISEEARAKLEAVAAIFDHNDEYISKTPMSKIVEEYGDQIAEAMPGPFAWTKERYMRVLQRVSKYLRGELDGRTVEVDDVEATNRKIDAAINEEDFEKWLRELFDGVQGRAGIAREVDPYDRRGNRKSFAQTHYEVTAENIVRALYENAERKGANFMGASAEGIAAVASKEYKSINAIRKDKGRLYTEDAEAHYARYQKLDDELNAIMDDVRSVNPYADMDAAATAIMNAAQDGSRTAAAIVRSFKKNGLTIDKTIGERIAAMYKEASEFPTGYFEAKPERVVGFDEVKAAIVPASMDAGVRVELDKVVENVIVYPDGDEDARLKALNGLTEVRFSLNNTAHARFDTASEAEKSAKAMRDSYINSDAFKKWFDGSVVTEPDGTPKIMYHGTSRSGFSMFDTYGSNYGLMGMGSYFTEDTDIADSYTHKGRGNAPGVYAVYLSIKNPVDMDAVASERMIRAWNEAFGDYVTSGDIHNGMTNEQALRVVEEALQYERVGKFDAIEMLQDFYLDQGYDGVTHMGGGRVNKYGPRHRVYIAFEPTQIKSATANVGNFDSDHGDIRFSLNNTAAIESMLTEDQNLMLPKDVDVTVPDADAVMKQAAKAVREGISERMSQQIAGVANKIAKETKSRYPKAEIAANLRTLIEEYGRNGASEDTARAVAEMAKKIIEQSERVDNTVRDQYSEIRKWLRENGLSLTDSQKQEAANNAGSYDAWRRSMMGTVKLTNEGMTLEEVWAQLSDKHPELFPAGTQEGDMLMKLEDFRDLMKPKYENAYGMDMEGAAMEMAMRIQGDLMGIIGVKDAAQHMYGSAEKIRKSFEAEFKEKLALQKKERVERFQQIAADLKAAKAKGDSAEQAKIMNRYRAALKATALDEAYAEVRATYKEREAQKAENRKANELRGRVAKRAGELMNMFARPEKGKRIPTGLQGLVLDVLETLDINGEHAAAAGKETKKAAEFREKLGGIRSFYEQVINSQSKGEAPEGMDGLMMAFTERNLGDVTVAIETLLESGDKFRLRDMNSQELHFLESLLNTVKHTVETVGKLWRIQRYQNVAELAETSIEEMSARGKRKNRDGSASAVVRDFLALDMLEPVSYGERLGEGGSVIVQGLMDGEKEKFAKIREAAEATAHMMNDAGINGYDIGKWRKHIHTIKLGDGHVVKMTDVEVMELYVSANRPQGLQHLLGGGMVLEDSKRAGVRGDEITLTQADIAKITKLMDPKQKKIADMMQAYLSSDVAKWGNDVTQRMYLYDAFTEHMYWPISSDSDSLKTSEPERDRSLTAITNAGITKALNEKANNAIIIGDIFDTFNKHIGDMASYAGYAEVMTDALAWFNYRQKAESGQKYGGVKKAMRDLLGEDGISYLTKLLQDINGARRGGDNTQFSGAFGKLTGNAKKAAVAGKIRVAIQQWTSIVRAAMEINPRFLISKLGAGKKTIAEMQQWSSLAWWKSNGNYEIGIGKSTDQIFWGDTSRLDPAIENTAKVFALGFDPGKMDDMTWAQMWTAVKSETKHTRKDLKVGSDEYFRAVAERFEYIMDRTQVVDTVMHRSDLMRSKDGTTKALTAFMGEPTKSYNMLARAIMNAGRNPKDPKAYGKVARAYTVYAASAAAVVAMTALFDSLKYRDDDEEFWEYFGNGMWFKKWGERWRDNILDAINPFNDIPIVSQVLDIINGGDVPTIMALDGVEDAVKAVKTTMNYFAEGNTGKYSAYGVFKALATAGSTITGLPVNGMLANMEMLTHAYDPELLQTKSNMASTEQAFEKLYDAVLSGDRSKELEIRTELAKGMYGKAPKSVKEIDAGISDQLAISDERILKAWQMKNTGKDTKGLVALYNEIQKDGFTDEMIKRAVNNAQSKYQAEYDALIEDDKPNEAQALLEKCAKYGMNLEKEKEPKDLEAELKATTYTDKELFRIIRNGDLTDIAAAAEIKIAESDAKKPEETVRSAVSGEFREEYVELVKAGKTIQAEELAGKLAIFDLDDEDLLEWVKDDYRSNLKRAIEKGDMKESERLIETMRDEYGLNDESIASTVRSRFKQDYIDLVMAGKDREADELAEKLMGLGLKYSDGSNRFKQANLNKWVLDWEKAQEDSE